MYQKKQFDETNRWSLFSEENKKSDNVLRQEPRGFEEQQVSIH